MTVLTSLAVVASVLVMRLFHVSRPVPPLPPTVRRFLYAMTGECCKTSVGNMGYNSDDTGVETMEKQHQFMNMNTSNTKEDHEMTPVEHGDQVNGKKSNKSTHYKTARSPENMKDKNEADLTEEENRLEWQMVARLCDKMCMVVFFLIILISTTVSFLPHITGWHWHFVSDHLWPWKCDMFCSVSVYNTMFYLFAIV